MRIRSWVPGAALALLTADMIHNGVLRRTEERLSPPPPPSAGRWPLVTRLGERRAMLGAGAISTAIAISLGRDPLRPALLIGAGYLAREATMDLVQRPRPPAERGLVVAEGSSYPSRHVTCCALGVVALCEELPASRWINVAAVGTVGVECFSRFRLGVHWPSDTLGAVLLVETIRLLIGSSGPPPSPVGCRSIHS